MRSIVRDVGQRFMVGFDGMVPSQEVRTLLRDFGLGAVFLTARNIEAPEQVAELVRELQEGARLADQPAPLLIAVAHEGGRTAPFGAPWTGWPSARALARAESEDLVRRFAEARAKELHACGITVNIAPLLDVETRAASFAGDRALGDDPERVGRLAAVLVEASQRAGVAVCAPGFPGTGDAETDPDETPTTIAQPPPRLDDVELRPFRAVLAADVAMIAVSAALYPEIDDIFPATLSHELVHEKLRASLGFTGVVASAPLDAPALRAKREISDRAVRASDAGCDLLRVTSTDVHLQVDAIEAVIRHAEDDVFPFRKRNEPLAAIIALKQRFLFPYSDPDPRRARAAVGTLEHQAIAVELAERAGVRL
jgi:beta-N-acetylhexosaminidase